jgi:hypothetical protein
MNVRRHRLHSAPIILALAVIFGPACNCDNSGLGKLSPILSVTDPQRMEGQEYVLDFGTVVIGTKVEKAVVIENDGSAIGFLKSAGLRSGSDPAFTMPMPVTPPNKTAVQPKASVSIAVDVLPTASGPIDGHVDITTTDPKLATVAVKLIATGTTTPPPPKLCALQVTPTVGDFGTVSTTGFQDIQFTMSSTGSKDCTVSNLDIMGSPSFTMVMPPMLSFTIVAGASAPLLVRYKPSDAIDETATLEIVSDDPAHPMISIPLKAKGVTPPASDCFIRFVPKPVDFGAVSIGATATQRVAIWNFGGGKCDFFPPRILPSPDAAAFSVTLVDPQSAGASLLPGMHLDADVLFSPTRMGSYSAEALASGGSVFFSVVTSSDTVPLLGKSGQAHLCLMPDELDFGTVQPGTHKDLTFDMSGCGDAAIAVRGVQMGAGSSQTFSLDPPPQTPISIPPHTSNTVSVRFSPTTSSATFGLVEVLSNDATAPRATVRLRGNAPMNCDQIIACSPASLGFPRTVTGRTSSTRFTCTNMGTRDVTVSAVRLRGGTSSDYTITSASLPYTLHAGDQLRIGVDFTPTQVGSEPGSLEVDTDACYAPIQLVTLLGEGKAPDDPHCTGPGLFQPTTRWAWSSPRFSPDSFWVTASPIVVPLVDTNGDGFINEDDIPGVVFVSFVGNGAHGPGQIVPSVVRAIRGDDASSIWDVSDPSLRAHWGGQVAAADLDGDGIVEIVVPLAYQTSATDMQGHGKYRMGRLMCFDHLGHLKWLSDFWHRPDTETDDFSGPAIGDLDGDGSPEIVLGSSVFDATGRLLWEGHKGMGSAHFGPLSVIADLDGDGKSEIVAGSTAYRSDGTILWNYEQPPALTVDGHPIVIDTDGDGLPEVVLRTGIDTIVVLNGADGSIKYGPHTLMNTNGCQAPIAAADLDGDGKPELGIPAGDIFIAMRPTGEVIWTHPIEDYVGQCGAAGAAAFDFEGDGRFELVYSDAQQVWIFRGTDGQPIFQMARTSETLYETPVIADVDGDGHAEILLTQWDTGGLKLVSNMGNDWIGTRRIWNEHSYHVTNIDAGGSVPRVEGPGWRRFSGYRANIPYCVP